MYDNMWEWLGNLLPKKVKQKPFEVTEEYLMSLTIFTESEAKLVYMLYCEKDTIEWHPNGFRQYIGKMKNGLNVAFTFMCIHFYTDGAYDVTKQFDFGADPSQYVKVTTPLCMEQYFEELQRKFSMAEGEKVLNKREDVASKLLDYSNSVTSIDVRI